MCFSARKGLDQPPTGAQERQGAVGAPWGCPKVGESCVKCRGRHGAERALSKAQPPSRAPSQLWALPLIDTLYIYPTTQVMYHRPTPSFLPKKEKASTSRVPATPQPLAPPDHPSWRGTLTPAGSSTLCHPAKNAICSFCCQDLLNISVLGLKLLPPWTGSAAGTSHFERIGSGAKRHTCSKCPPWVSTPPSGEQFKYVGLQVHLQGGISSSCHWVPAGLGTAATPAQSKQLPRVTLLSSTAPPWWLCWRGAKLQELSFSCSNSRHGCEGCHLLQVHPQVPFLNPFLLGTAFKTPGSSTCRATLCSGPRVSGAKPANSQIQHPGVEKETPGWGTGGSLSTTPCPSPPSPPFVGPHRGAIACQ